LLAETYQCVGFAMASLGRSDLAWIAADRGILAAKQSEDRLMVAAGSRLLAHALLAAGRHDKAQQIAVTALTTLEPGLGSAVPAQLSIYGALLQTSAVVAARRGDRAGANAFLAEAGVVAQRLGADRNDLWTVFGPTNVGIHRPRSRWSWVMLAGWSSRLGRSTPRGCRRWSAAPIICWIWPRAMGSGVRTTRPLTPCCRPSGWPPKKSISSQQPVVQRLVVELLHRERRTTKPRLRELATRVGVLAA
jgi:hypothetical protein